MIDISYIQTKQGILCLSVSRDLYDNSIVGYKTATQQTVKLVLNTIRLAMNKEKVVGELNRPILCGQYKKEACKG